MEFNQDHFSDSDDNDTSRIPGAPDSDSPDSKKMMASASMACGIFGVMLLCSCASFPLSILLGVAAIMLAVLSRNGKRFYGPAVTGLILGIISLVLGVAEGVYLILINYMLRDPEIASMLDQMLEQYGLSPVK